jgi:hypothetical protein
MKKLLIAGGLCGTTMLRAGELIRETCEKQDTPVDVTIQNLWETTYVAGRYDVIVEMFPFFKNQSCPVISGKPYISHVGEKELTRRVADVLCADRERESA